MDRTCGIDCNFCYPNEWRDKSEFDCAQCIKVTELPSGLDNITGLDCRYCVNLSFIPSLPFLTTLSCTGCPLITCIPDLPNIEYIYVHDCKLLSEWKQRGENVIVMNCRNTPLLHLHPSLFIRFNGLDWLDDEGAQGDPRPRNGVSSRLVSSFTVCKKLYCFELPSRIALEVSLNSILYAPGGAKYLELADRYKDRIQVFKKRKI